MRSRRRFVEVPGEPAKVASRAAVRLAHLGDIVEPLSEIEFIWRPQEAEQYLFRCPDAVRVTVLPADEPGFSAVAFEWRRTQWPRGLRGLPTALALVSVALLLLTPHGWPAWRVAMGGFPLLMLLLAPVIMDSGWFSRLCRCCSRGATIPFERVPDALHWLCLDEPRQAQVVAELRLAADDVKSDNPRKYHGRQHTSDQTRMGWPLYHLATGWDFACDASRLARGWVAIGGEALGRVAVGGNGAHGWVALGGYASGVSSCGCFASGLVAGLGMAAVGAVLSLAGYGIGVVVVGPWALGLWLWPGHSWATDDSGLYWMLPFAFAGGVGLLLVRDAIRYLVKVRPGRVRTAERLQEYRGQVAAPDSSSLSLAERLTSGDHAERGLSSPASDESSGTAAKES